MSKEDFISVFELTLLCADIDVAGLYHEESVE